ncbi:TonB-dependent receptor [Duganella ginsengisoli]|uniref:TonB-dependent receptor n=1 Tax=Pseudoduganella ginsengisoli TaxID=1462440 RepID=A0A6L6Q6Q0_9BURK|nr:TonB-dependent receptor [Pseudoduganella ginsengisoli]MTW04782.1 TonB-dependent receptor [Pseudoduganella ginsengisoli]
MQNDIKSSMMNKETHVKHSSKLQYTVLVASLAAAFPGLALAQETDSKHVQKVVVTGSNIKRVDSETASPVQVVSRQEIEQSGAQTVAQILNNLTGNDRGAISDLGGTNSWASGASGVSMRNLGTGATLVLLNGRRLSAYGFADALQANFVNIDSIPSDVIDRVEILKDGASAVYGSDAVAGVINIITRKNFRGVGVKASAQQSLERSFLNREHKASIIGGTGDFDTDGYNAFAHLELYSRGKYTDRQVRPLLPDWYIRMNPDRDATSTGSIPGNYVGRYPANYSDPKLAGKSINVAAPGCAPENLKGGLCFYDYWQDSLARPPAERATFLGSAKMKLPNDMTGYAELQLAKTRNDYHTAPPRSSVTGVPLSWYDSITGKMQYFTDPQLPVGHPNNPYSFPIGLNYRFADDRDMFKNVGSSDQFRALAGIQGESMGWEWDSAVGIMGSKARQRQHLYRDRYAYADAIVSGAYKFGQTNDRALLEKMFPEMGSHGQYRQAFMDFKASRELYALPGGPLQLATGVDLRHESFEHMSSDNVLEARIVQFSGVKIDGARNVAAAFAELAAPFTKQLEGSFAIRGDKVINQAGAIVPKFGLRYTANDMLMVRGTVSKGFRAPSLPETGNGGASWFNNGYLDPKRCAAATELRNILNTGNAADKNLALTAYDLGCKVNFPSVVTPNPDLKPEHTNSFTAGLVLQPIRALSFTIDYYNIKRRDEIAVKDIDQTLANEDRTNGLVQRDPLTTQDIDIARRAAELSGKNVAYPIGPIRTIAAQYQNYGKSRVSGIDLDAKGRWTLGDMGTVNVGLELNHQFEYQQWDSFANTYTQNYVGYRGVPRTRAVAKLSWENAVLVTGLRANFASGTQLAWGELDTANTIDGCAGRSVSKDECKIASDTTVDFWTRYTFRPGTTISANVFNLFDRKDPVKLYPNSALPLRTRTLKLTVEHMF